MKWRSYTMKIELDDNIIYDIKDAVMVQFLKDDLDSVKENLARDFRHDDIKYDKKLIKAYKTVLKYYGVYND